MSPSDRAGGAVDDEHDTADDPTAPSPRPDASRSAGPVRRPTSGAASTDPRHEPPTGGGVAGPIRGRPARQPTPAAPRGAGDARVSDRPAGAAGRGGGDSHDAARDSLAPTRRVRAAGADPERLKAASAKAVSAEGVASVVETAAQGPPTEQVPVVRADDHRRASAELPTIVPATLDVPQVVEARTGVAPEIGVDDTDLAVAPAIAVEPPRPVLFDEAASDSSIAATSATVVRRRKPRVRRVTRVVRHVDPWSVFKVALIFSLVLYGVVLTAGVLLWRVARDTGTLDNLERWFEDWGWAVFELKGGEIYHNAWVGGLFGVIGLTGLAVLAATLFNLVTDLVGGVRLTVLEEEVVERSTAPLRRLVLQREASRDKRRAKAAKVAAAEAVTVAATAEPAPTTVVSRPTRQHSVGDANGAGNGHPPGIAPGAGGSAEPVDTHRNGGAGDEPAEPDTVVPTTS